MAFRLRYGPAIMSDTTLLQAEDFVPLSLQSASAPCVQATGDNATPALPFITQPMSIMVDLVRGCAAVAVLIGHAVALKIYTGPFPLSEMLQHNAVMVFFVLSGLVISSSLRNNQYSLPDYAIARAARILPVSVPAIFFASGCYALAQWLGYPNFSATGYPILNVRSFVTPLFFLSETAYGAGPVWDRPYWSLCYEETYYALFGCAMLMRGPRRFLACLVIAAVAGIKILLLAPVWLMGMGLTYYGTGVHVSLRTGMICLLLAAVGALAITHFAWHGSVAVLAYGGWTVNDAGPSQYFLTDYALGLMIALGFIGLRPISTALCLQLRRVERPIRALAGFSFTLYLFHWPLFCLMRASGLTCGHSVPAFIGVLTATLAASALLAMVTEHRRTAVRRILRQLVGMASTPTARASE